MNPEQLRQTIVQATIPLMHEYATLTTTQIAQAAGIGEADLLAVYADKEAVMQACAATLTESMTAVLNPAEEVRELEAIHTHQPLASRLVKVIDIVDAYYHRIRVDLSTILPARVPAAGTADTPGIRPVSCCRCGWVRWRGARVNIPQDEFRSLSSSSSEIR